MLCFFLFFSAHTYSRYYYCHFFSIWHVKFLGYSGCIAFLIVDSLNSRTELNKLFHDSKTMVNLDLFSNKIKRNKGIPKMTYQSRSSRIKSLARNDDSIYWSAIDTFSSNVTDVTRSSSRQSFSAHSRNYIDPWDLENYAYIQR